MLEKILTIYLNVSLQLCLILTKDILEIKRLAESFQ